MTTDFTRNFYALSRYISDSEVLIHEAIARAKEPRFVMRTLSNNFTPIDHSQVFAPIEDLKTTIREAGGWEAYWAGLPSHDGERHLHWMRLAQQEERRFHSLQSALGFEPTEHSDAPPCIPTAPTTKPQPKPCVDFGFEPTEGCE